MRKHNFFKILLSLVLGVSMMGTLPAVYAETEVEDETVTVVNAEAALEILKEGNERFVNDEGGNYDASQARRDELKDGQAPFAVVVTCSDSRVVPEHLFDQGLGDLFVIRVAGNTLSDSELGSVEYGVAELGAELVVILGHESCGAVTAAVAANENPSEVETTEYIDAFLEPIADAVEQALETGLEGEDLVEEAATLNVENTIAHLLENSELVKDAVDGGAQVVGAKYLFDGDIDWYE